MDTETVVVKREEGLTHDASSSHAIVHTRTLDTYRLPDGTTLSKAYPIEPQRRRTVWLDSEAESDPALAALASTAVAVTVTSDLPIAVTRKMYWPSPLEPDGWGESSDAAGITSTTLKAYIARAMVGGPDEAGRSRSRRRRPAVHRSSRPTPFRATRG